MGKDEPLAPALAEPGPHGFPARWILYQRSCKTLKIGPSKENPVHYIERHSFWRRHPWQVLHESAHKADKSPALVAIYKPKKSFFFRPRDFLIKFPDGKGNGGGHDMEMKHIQRGLGGLGDVIAYEFCLGGKETFHWRKAAWGSHCEEVRAIRKEDEPVVHTGDAKPPKEEGFHFTKPYSGWILVRVNSSHAAPQGGEANGTGNQHPMGYTDSGEEIVASYCEASGWVATRKVIFQFWGAGLTGELGEDFTRVAALTGSTIWDDEERERARRRAKANRNNGSN